METLIEFGMIAAIITLLSYICYSVEKTIKECKQDKQKEEM